MRIKKTNTRGKKSNAKTNHLKDIISNNFDTKEKETSENQYVTKKSKIMINQIKSSNEAIQNSSNLLHTNEEKLSGDTKTTIQNNYQILNCSVNLEDIMKTQVKYHGLVEKTSEILDHSKSNKNLSFEEHNQMKSAENQFEPKTNLTDTTSKTKIKNKFKNLNTKMKTEEPEEKKKTQTTVRNSIKLHDNNEGRLPENEFSNGTTNKKTKRVSFIGISNKSVGKKKKSISKNHYLKNVSNIIEIKEDIMKTQVKYHVPMEKTSKTLDHTKPNKNSSFEVHNHMKSAHEKFEPKTSLIDTTTKITMKNKCENLNTKMKTEELDKKQRTETIVKRSLKLPDTNEGRLPENANFEMINAEHASRIHSSIVTTVKMRRRRPSIMIRAHYQDSNFQHKRKLSDVEEMNSSHK